MTKKTSATTKKTTKAAAVAAPAVSFGTWLKTARARGEVADLIKTLKADKKITDKSTLKYVLGKYSAEIGMGIVSDRYEAYAKRGSLAGLRSRAKAAA